MRNAATRWDFEHGLEGWGASSEDSSHISLRVHSGELIGAITGDNPEVESPRFVLGTTNRTHLVLRMRYLGSGNMDDTFCGAENS